MGSLITDAPGILQFEALVGVEIPVRPRQVIAIAIGVLIDDICTASFYR